MQQNFDLIETAFNVMKFFVPFLFALCFHEFAHGWVARLRGDRTAEIMGRLTLNPMAHADPIGTVVFPILAQISHVPLFGWAKPVPVDERNLKNPKVDMFWIAAAGPLSNLLLAFIGAAGLGLSLRYFGAWFEGQEKAAIAALDVFKMFITINVFLAVFNLLPLHPLDGGKVLARFLPDRWNDRLEEMQSYTSLFLILMFLMGGFWIISTPARFVTSLFFLLAEKVAFT